MRLDRPVLVSNLVAGASWLVVPLLLGMLALALIGLGYVVAASALLAAAYGRPMRSRRQELAVWCAPWVAAVAVWFAVLAPIDGPGPFALGLAVVVATPLYAVWQLSAGLLRELARWWSSARGDVVGGA